MADTPVCSHPELRPTHWDQPRPAPMKMVACDCGLNASCPICGYGWGAYPCNCNKAAWSPKCTTQFEDGGNDTGG